MRVWIHKESAALVLVEAFTVCEPVESMQEGAVMLATQTGWLLTTENGITFAVNIWVKNDFDDLGEL